MSKERFFFSEWTGVAIFLAPKPSYQPHKDKKEWSTELPPLIFKQKSLIAYISLKLISHYYQYRVLIISKES